MEKELKVMNQLMVLLEDMDTPEAVELLLIAACRLQAHHEVYNRAINTSCAHSTVCVWSDEHLAAMYDYIRPLFLARSNEIAREQEYSRYCRDQAPQVEALMTAALEHRIADREEEATQCEYAASELRAEGC